MTKPESEARLASPTQRHSIDFLLQGAIWQDSLLQSYRVMALTLQGISLAIGTGLAVFIFQSDKLMALLLSACLLFFLTLASVLILFMLKGVIQARGEDVSYWHTLIIRAEQKLQPTDRYFTKFKLQQRTRRSELKDIQRFLPEVPRSLTEDEIEELVGRGLGHTRAIIDSGLIWGIFLMWILLCASSVYAAFTKG